MSIAARFLIVPTNAIRGAIFRSVVGASKAARRRDDTRVRISGGCCEIGFEQDIETVQTLGGKKRDRKCDLAQMAG